MSACLQEKHSGLLAIVNLGQALPLEGGRASFCVELQGSDRLPSQRARQLAPSLAAVQSHLVGFLKLMFNIHGLEIKRHITLSVSNWVRGEESIYVTPVT